MKLLRIILIVCAASLFVYSSCNQDDDAVDTIPVYNSAEDIVNPPDTFKIVFNLRSTGVYPCNIQFDTNSVWQIEKLTAHSAIVWFERPDTTAIWHFDGNITNLGLSKNIAYTINGQANNPTGDISLFLEFTKTSIPYIGFHPSY